MVGVGCDRERWGGAHLWLKVKAGSCLHERSALGVLEGFTPCSKNKANQTVPLHPYHRRPSTDHGLRAIAVWTAITVPRGMCRAH